MIAEAQSLGDFIGAMKKGEADAFLYLLAFITLSIWAIQLGSLMFHAIDRSFPNPALDFFNSTFTARTRAIHASANYPGSDWQWNCTRHKHPQFRERPKL